MSNWREHPAFETALEQASDELRLASYYRDCVRPLLRMPQQQWPRCCGRGCEPCADQLVEVAQRIIAILQTQMPAADGGAQE